LAVAAVTGIEAESAADPVSRLVVVIASAGAGASVSVIGIVFVAVDVGVGSTTGAPVLVSDAVSVISPLVLMVLVVWVILQTGIICDF
jgi:hypothetical protein